MDIESKPLNKIDGEVVVSGGEVTTRGSRRYLIVSDIEVGMNGMTHVEMFHINCVIKPKLIMWCTSLFTNITHVSTQYSVNSVVPGVQVPSMFT